MIAAPYRKVDFLQTGRLDPVAEVSRHLLPRSCHAGVLIIKFFSARRRIRTGDPWLRRPILYPAELVARRRRAGLRARGVYVCALCGSIVRGTQAGGA